MTLEEHLKIADRSIEIKDFAVAKANYSYARRINYYDWRVWWGLTRCLTHDFTTMTSDNWYKFAEEALRLCKDEEEVSNMKEKIEAYNKDALEIIKNRKEIRENSRKDASNPGSMTWVWITLGALALFFIIIIMAS